MSKDALPPEPKKPVETEPKGSATQPKDAEVSVNDDDEMVPVRKGDLKKLQSQRDSNYETVRNTQMRVAMLEMTTDIKDFLSTNKAKFPDVTVEDLYDAEKPEDFETIALKVQDRYDRAVQRKMGELQNSPLPVMTTEERLAKEKKLKANPSSKSFRKMLEGRLPRLNNS